MKKNHWTSWVVVTLVVAFVLGVVGLRIYSATGPQAYAQAKWLEEAIGLGAFALFTIVFGGAYVLNELRFRSRRDKSKQ